MIAIGVFLGWRAIGAPGPALPLHAIATYPLSGNTGRLDYESFDSAAGLLFVAHLGDNSVIAFDTVRNRVVATVPNITSVRGVLVVPSLHCVYAAAQDTQEIVVIDEFTAKVIARAVAGDVDGMAFDPDTQQLFVSDESGATDAVIDTRTNLLRMHIALGGEAGNTQHDDARRHIFVAVQTTNELAEIDPKTRLVVRRFPLPGCFHGHGLQLDSRHHVAYIACQWNSRVVELDLVNGNVVTAASVGIGADVLAMDFALERLYSPRKAGS